MDLRNSLRNIVGGSRMENTGYYSYENIDATGAQYRMIIGERSNGKTYGALKKAVENYVDNGKQTAYIRRYKEDFVGKRGQALFSAIVADGWVEELTGGEWDSIQYYSSAWYLRRNSGQKGIRDEKPFCYGFALNSMEHDKSTSYPDIDLVIFDEFLSRTFYLQNEFVLFMNVLSTIIRQRDDTVIYMLGNTVSQYSPYFLEMGIDIKSMQQGELNVVKYGKSDLRVAVEYVSPMSDEVKKSKDYFAFNNPKLKMINEGEWELDIYPHLMDKYVPKEIIGQFFIEHEDEVLHCEVVRKRETEESKQGVLFVYVHRKTSDIDLEKDKRVLLFTSKPNSHPRVEKRITKPITERGKIFSKLLLSEKTYFQDNTVGESLRNYLEWCKQTPIFRY